MFQEFLVEKVYVQLSDPGVRVSSDPPPPAASPMPMPSASASRRQPRFVSQRKPVHSIMKGGQSTHLGRPIRAKMRAYVTHEMKEAV
jgi:hypothetical protein